MLSLRMCSAHCCHLTGGRPPECQAPVWSQRPYKQTRQQQMCLLTQVHTSHHCCCCCRGHAAGCCHQLQQQAGRYHTPSSLQLHVAEGPPAFAAAAVLRCCLLPLPVCCLWRQPQQYLCQQPPLPLSLLLSSWRTSPGRLPADGGCPTVRVAPGAPCGPAAGGLTPSAPAAPMPQHLHSTSSSSALQVTASRPVNTCPSQHQQRKRNAPSRDPC